MFNFNVCDVALRHAPEFRRVYLPNDVPAFQQVLEKLESDPVCQRLSLKSFLILPFQRITRLKLLVQVTAMGTPISSSTGQQATTDRTKRYSQHVQKLARPFALDPNPFASTLQNILKRTPPGADEELQATQAYDALEKLIKDCNENVQRMKSTEELIYLSQNMEFECKIFPLISQSRRLIKRGELIALEYNLSLKWKLTTRPIYLHLFNDYLLLSRPRE
ncbi:hypothetical protein lerEdw1_019496 [Lerista edwardsae]|nr:hypothetical protein lerEdw1_019496 [Lerista edwardsae]